MSDGDAQSHSLGRLEHDVEVARAKLAADLDRLRAPASREHFRSGLMREAVAFKDAKVTQLTEASDNVVQSMLHEIKARAVANPAAVAVIAAGVAWRLIRRPPVALTMVGLGAWSLWHTEPASAYEVKRTSDAVSDVVERVGDLREQVVEGASNLASRTADLAEQVGASAAETGARARQHVAETAAKALSSADAAAARASEALTDMRSTVAESASGLTRLASDTTARDRLLLGAAAAAIAAAAGIASQRRATRMSSGAHA